MRSGLRLNGKRFALWVLVLILKLGAGGSVRAQSGYMGKKNELGADLFNALYQGAYELEYKRSLNKHVGLILTAGYYASKKNYEDRPIKKDPISSLTTGPTFGIGIGYNRSHLNMAYPIGWCLSYGYKYTTLSIKDRYPEKGPFLFEQEVHETYIRCSRNYNLTDHINLQLAVRTGAMLSVMERTEPEDFSRKPLRVIPAGHPFSEDGTYQIREYPGGNYRLRFFLMPVVRVAHLF